MKRKAVFVRLREKDSDSGVTHRTLKKLSDAMGLKETEVIHKALAHYASTFLPRYDVDNGPLTKQQQDRIDELTADTRATYREAESLFGEPGVPGEKQDGESDGKRVRTVSRTR